MDNITRAQLDALEGKRAPPDCTFLMGAGEYRSQLLLPSLQRDAKMRDIAQRTTNIKNMNMTNTANKLGSGAAWNTVREGQIPGGDNNVSLPDALAIAEATMVASEPVHVYDLKETAARKTQELIEKEKMVNIYKRIHKRISKNNNLCMGKFYSG